MGKIFYLMGKSASGKDSVFKELIRSMGEELRTVTMYTTRPIRAGETDGIEYFFVTEKQRQELEQEGRLIESRTYETVHGPWSYFTVDDGQIDLEKQDYLMIGTPESYEKTRTYFGAGRLIPLYIYVEDGERLARALARERGQKRPRYEELCRRFLADAEDFSEEKLERAGIGERVENRLLSECVEQCRSRIEKERLFLENASES